MLRLFFLISIPGNGYIYVKLDWRTEMVRSFCISSVPFMDRYMIKYVFSRQIFFLVTSHWWHCQ